MKCVVMGGAGFIGSHLVTQLVRSGLQVRVFDKSDAANLDLVDTYGSEVVTGNFLNVEDVRNALTGCDVVYHLVSTTTPQTSNKDPVYDVETNISGTLRLLDAARKEQINKIVFLSSGGTVYGLAQEVPIKESHPTQPITAYGINKLAIEKYIHLYWVLYGLDYCILRASNAYGERQPANNVQGVISSLLWNSTLDRESTVWGDGSITRDYIHVEDIARALTNALSHSGKERILNIGTGIGTQLNELIRYIEKITGRSLSINRRPNRKYDVPINILDSSLANENLGWRPEVSLENGILRTYRWIQKISPSQNS